MLVGAGVVSWFLLPTPLHILVDHHLPRCVSVGMRSVGLLFLHGALGSHPFFPLLLQVRVAAARVPAGVISAEPGDWHTRIVLVGAGVTGFAAHSPQHSGGPPHTLLCFHVQAAQHFHPSIQGQYIF